jgi:hypothetical protein
MLFLTVIDEAGDFAAKVFAVNNHIDETVFEHKLRGLETFWKLDFNRLGDCSRAREAD